ncbi:alpha/beta-hydrolase [Coniochaeta ligniaria NRRL 30616]|uniref:Alpha/beta-hydrolase n=1 Tax=Coniochaeta ligniaria NRRL 30616 TaxID=1408157 RepID=A0A1J7IQ17_9PEZI|nr:alpha/beta-hydrolase [Coniochaeta ligniaria NRRL 30616]
MFETNPNLVQELPHSLDHIQPPPPPIVLIHDGGGTIYSYYCLGMLNRPVYAIYNPYYGTENVWAGGIPEMAAHYVALIKQAIPKGDIILGGWSLGGLLSLQVARLLAEDTSLRVLGIVMIDSIYPRAPSFQKLGGSRIVQHALEWGSSTKEETRQAVKRCFDEAGRMVREWRLPTWEAREGDDGEMYEPVMPGEDLRPPPVWLLRAEEPVPVLGEGVSRVDTYRKERYLGWDNYREGFIVKVEDIPGHHFNIFSFEHVDAVTEKLRQACVEVEHWARRKDGGSSVEAWR